jgi:uncharacterized membrane protein (Fun14 family)
METPTTHQGLFDTIKSKIEGFIGKFNLSWQQLTQLGIALAIGITLGFLVKRFGRQTLFFIILCAGILFGLQYFNVITIQWTNLKNLVGLAPADTVEGFFRTYFEWAQHNILAVITGLIGFIIGYKIS